jgi:hypothetical protein
MSPFVPTLEAEPTTRERPAPSAGHVLASFGFMVAAWAIVFLKLERTIFWLRGEIQTSFP